MEKHLCLRHSPLVQRREMTIVAIATLVLSLAGCGGGSGGPGSSGSSQPGPPASIAVVNGASQTATVGTELPAAVTVVVRDASGNPVPGQLVDFVVETVGGTVSTSSIVTDSNEDALTHWTLATTSGTQPLEAEALNGVTGAVLLSAAISASASPGPANALIQVSGNNKTATTGAALAAPIVVKVVDNYGNPPGTLVTFYLPAGASGQLTGATPTTNAQGTASLGSWMLSPKAGLGVLGVVTAGVPAATVYATGTSGPPANVSIVAGNNQSSAPGGQVPTPPLADANGNGVAGVAVTFSVTSGGGSVAGGTTTMTASVQGIEPDTFTATAGIGVFSSIATGEGGTCALNNSVAYC